MQAILGTLIGVALLCVTAEASCAFPAALNGTWKMNGYDRTVTFINNKLYGFEIDIYKDVVFDCYLSYNGKYAFVSAEENLFNYKVRLYFCWQLVRINENTFLYYEMTERARKEFKDRGRAFLVEEVPYPSMNVVCEKHEDVYGVLSRVGA